MNTVLPVERSREKIVSAIRDNQVTLILGTTGSGKTTRIPQFILDAGIVGTEGRIVCTQPRRLAAVGVASRVAGERDQEIGEEVGYHIRFERRASGETRLKFVTCGVLLREVMDDPLLLQYSCVVVDEAHERDIFTDFLIGYLKEVCRKRPDFKLVVMSATLDWREFERFFDGSVTVRIPVPVFPVAIEYRPVSEDDLLDLLVGDIQKLHGDGKDVSEDILVFLPGEREIRSLCERLESQGNTSLAVFPLYGLLSSDQQSAALAPSKYRKVIVATNIAESSLTFGRVMVLDSGLVRMPFFDAHTGIGSLELVKISQSSAEQRAGRAGRVAPGRCIRYYSETDFLQRLRYDLPEIVRSDLTSLALTMKSLGLGDGFVLPTAPPRASWYMAEQVLTSYGALDACGAITDYGKMMATMPVEPAIAHFILQNKDVSYGFLKVLVTIAAMLAVCRFFTYDPAREKEIQNVKESFQSRSSDFLTLLKIWKAYRKSRYGRRWCVAHYLNPYWMQAVRAIRVQLRVWVRKHLGRQEGGTAKTGIARAILKGFSRNLLCYGRDGMYRAPSYQSMVSLDRDSVLARERPEYVVCFRLHRGVRIFAEYNHLIPSAWVRNMIRHATPVVCDDPEAQRKRSLTVKGALRVSAKGASKLIRIDVSLERNAGTEVRLVDRGSAIIDETRYPVRLLPISSEALAYLQECHMETLAELLRQRERFLSDAVIPAGIRDGIKGVLVRLGYIPQELPRKPRERREPKEVSTPSSPLGIMEEEGVDDLLVTSLLGKPLEALGLAGTTLMHLWSIGIGQVGELIQRSERQLAGELRAIGSHEQRIETARLRAVQDVKERLAYFGLVLAPERREARGAPRSLPDSYGFVKDVNILSLRPRQTCLASSMSFLGCFGKRREKRSSSSAMRLPSLIARSPARSPVCMRVGLNEDG
ncbi:MAG: ATP-dependent RNA helicase [Candidatus Sungbacteria bacterium]|nr:ATP-dependent RNA helicase [Candidatus Sungbacteria bacterium]